MKWIVKLVAEPTPDHAVEQEIATLEREELVSPASVGLSIAEGKQILESLQKQMVAMQVQHHNASLKSCFRCGKSFRTKGYCRAALKSEILFPLFSTQSQVSIQRSLPLNLRLMHSNLR